MLNEAVFSTRAMHSSIAARRPSGSPIRAHLEQLRRDLEAARPDLRPSSPTFAAALVLLTGRTVPHNVDKLARRTRLPRDFVARCVRRLHDNQVWRGGATVAAWSGPADDAFWSDVAVAEGKMVRSGGPDGEFEWTPVGEQWKRSLPAGASSLEEETLPAAPDWALGAGSAEPCSPVAPRLSDDPEPRDVTSEPDATASQRAAAQAAPAEDRTPSQEAAPDGTYVLPELFPSAVWLR